MRAAIAVSILATWQTLARADGRFAIGARTVVDASETRSTVSAGVDASGDFALDLAFGFHLRGGGDATLGGGPSGAPSGGATIAAATPRGLFTTEVEQRVELHRLPALFAGRARAPGLRYDEATTTVRTSLATGETRSGIDATFLPVAVARTTAFAPDDVTTWTLHAGLLTGRSDTSVVDVLAFRSEWMAGASLHHIDIVDARVAGPESHGRARLGAADDDPVAASDSAAGLAYRTWEGELSFGGRGGAVGYDVGVRSDCMLTSDAKLAREHRLTAGVEHALAGGWLGIAGFVARTDVGELDQPQMPFARAWTYGAQTTYARRLDAFELAVVAAVGRTFHRRIADDAAIVTPGFAATVSLAVTASTGRSTTPGGVAMIR